MYYVYVLKSDNHNRIYIGSTSDVATRVTYHNTGKVRSTKPYLPWKLIYKESYQDKADVLKRERHQIKSSGFVRKQLKEGKYKGPIV